MTVRVSVIIPAFNPVVYLVDAVKSVIAQTFSDWELLIVDDGSTEALPELPEDPRVTLLHKPNGGVASARNFGMDKAACELVAFLDADDLWAPTKLSRQVEVM